MTVVRSNNIACQVREPAAENIGDGVEGDAHAAQADGRHCESLISECSLLHGLRHKLKGFAAHPSRFPQNEPAIKEIL